MSVQSPLLSLNSLQSCLSSTLCQRLLPPSPSRKRGCMYPIGMSAWERDTQILILTVRSDTIWPRILSSSMHMKHFKILYGLHHQGSAQVLLETSLTLSPWFTELTSNQYLSPWSIGFFSCPLQLHGFLHSALSCSNQRFLFWYPEKIVLLEVCICQIIF